MSLVGMAGFGFAAVGNLTSMGTVLEGPVAMFAVFVVAVSTLGAWGLAFADLRVRGYRTSEAQWPWYLAMVLGVWYGSWVYWFVGPGRLPLPPSGEV